MQIIKNIIRKILNRLFLRNLDDIKIQKGKIFEEKIKKNLTSIKLNKITNKYILYCIKIN